MNLKTLTAGKYKTQAGYPAEILFIYPSFVSDVTHPCYGWMQIPTGEKVAAVWNAQGISNYCYGSMAEENKRYNLKVE